MDHGKRHEGDQVDVEELGVCDIAADGVEEGAADELNDGVELDELEGLEGGRQGRLALDEELHDAADVLDLGGEGGRDRGLCFA